MRAMVLEKPGDPLQLRTLDKPVPANGQLLIKVAACGVCRTDLHLVDGELDNPGFPIIPGHQITGYVEQIAEGVEEFDVGQRVGIPWLGESCGSCEYCNNQQENLCNSAIYTGCHRDGGFAEYCIANAKYCFALPERYSDLQVAPLLCAGLIGYRAYRMTGNARRIGLYGFGAAAHILTQLAVSQGKELYAFTREGDRAAQQFALDLGACWAGDSATPPPKLLDAAIIFAPAGELVPTALLAVKKGGKVVCGGIHMSDIPSFAYDLLWGERSVCSVANLTRRDAEEFLPLAASIPITTETTVYPLEQANQALEDLRHGRFVGAAVISLHA